MAQQFAKDQPSGFTNRIERVAIVGAGGSVGKPIVEELLKTGRHTVTALTRKDSKSALPPGVKTATVDYDDEESLVSALRGQQFLIISLSVAAPAETQSKLLRAAARAGVPRVMPNGYGADPADEALARETMVGEAVRAACAQAEAAGLAWTTLACGFWYEFSLVSGPEWFGFDFAGRSVTLYDGGETRVSASSWAQCGRAVARLLDLKVLPEDEADGEPTVSRWRNRPLYAASFSVSQKEILESWKRVTGELDADWTVGYEPTADRYGRGLGLMQQGDQRGFAMAMYARVFFPNGGGNFEETRGLANEVLGFEKEDLDERTREAKRLLDSGYSYMTRMQ